MKKLRIVVVILLVVFVLGFAALWVLANPNRYRDTIQAELEKQLGRKVSLGEMSLGFLPLRFQVANPVIAEDPSIRQTPPFVKAENLDIRVGVLPLLHGTIPSKKFRSCVIPALSSSRQKTGNGIFRRSVPVPRASPIQARGPRDLQATSPYNAFRLQMGKSESPTFEKLHLEPATTTSIWRSITSRRKGHSRLISLLTFKVRPRRNCDCRDREDRSQRTRSPILPFTGN